MRRTLPFGSIIDKNYRSHNRIKAEEKRQKKDRKKKDSGKTLSFEGVGIPGRSRIQKRIKTPERRQLSV